MFRQFSRINVFLQLVTIIAVALVLFLPVIINPFPSLAARDINPLYAFFSAVLGDAALLKAILAMCILLFLSFFLFAMLGSHDMHPRESMLPALFYLLLSAGLIESVSFSPALIASLFLMMSLFLIIRIFGSNQPFKQIFSSSFCVSVAALFYPPAMTFMLFIWLSFLTYRIASWREWVISLIGAFVPLIYIISYFYWIGGLPEMFINYGVIFSNPYAGFPTFRLWQAIFIGFAGIAMVLGLLRQIILIQDKLISIRRKTWVFIDFTIIALLSSLLAGNDLPGHLTIIAIPGALFLSNSVTGKKASLTYELLAVLLVILLVFARLSA